MKQEVLTAEEVRALLANPHAMSRAKPTTIDGIKFRSRTEAKVYGILAATLKPGDKMLIHWKAPLLSIAPRITSKVPRIEIDFSIWTPGVSSFSLARAVDAKPAGGWRDPSWSRGRAAFFATYGIHIEEMS
jgi:hypothetical protein